jgi:hypothetical protein
MSIFAGTTLASAGIESLSSPAKFVASQICDKFCLAIVLDSSTIEIFDNGSVREVLQICLSDTTTLIFEFFDGRLIKFGQNLLNGQIWESDSPAKHANIWLTNLELDEIYARIISDEQEVSYQIWDQKQEEIDFLYHMMWDTDNYDFPPAAWERLANLEK